MERINLGDFKKDPHGRRYSDVLGDKRIPFAEVINFFNNENILRRMEESEQIHDHPALAGCVKELETLPVVDLFFSKTDAHQTTRFRQAIGVLVKMHMTRRGWKQTNRKGRLGTRIGRGRYVNTAGSLSKWFLSAERYTRRNPTVKVS
jgi:hypothetical protein